MNQFMDFLLQLLSQFGGGPGPPENNLVRFGLAGLMWAALLLVAWSRQREEYRPRERLLVAGFGLALFRELFMLSHVSLQILSGGAHNEHTLFCSVVVPIEHALTLTSIAVIAGSFLHYILDKPRLTRSYLKIGLGVAIVASVFTFISWPQALAVNPSVRFHETTAAWFIHLLGSLLLVLAIAILVTEKGWLRDLVLLALGFFLFSELLTLINFVSGRAYSQFLCPIGNILYMAGIPLFGLVYLREQNAEKRHAEEALQAYRNRLEELVDERTAELRTAYRQLQAEIEERTQAQAEIAVRNAELAAQVAVNEQLYQRTERWAKGMARLNELSLSLNATLDPEAIYRLITRQAAELVDCPVALFYGWDQITERARHSSSHGVSLCERDRCSMLTAKDAILAGLAASRHALQIATSAEAGDLPVNCQKCFAGKSLVGLTVRGTGGSLGFLLVAAAGADRHWSSDELELLERFADRAAIALEVAYLHQQLEWVAALEERQRIAADMHDGLAQTLSYLSLRTDWAHELLKRGDVEQVIHGLGKMQAAINQAHHDVRTSIATLRESPAPRRSVQELLQQITSRRGQDDWPKIAVETTSVDPLYLASDDTEQLTRVVKEALANAHRHGRAREVRIKLSQEPGCYKLSITDDGRGFEPNAPGNGDSGHFGLSIMQARASRLGGSLSITSRPGSGTTVTLTWRSKTAAGRLAARQRSPALGLEVP